MASAVATRHLARPPRDRRPDIVRSGLERSIFGAAAVGSAFGALPFLAGRRGPILRVQHQGCAVAGDSDGRWEAWMTAAQSGDARAYDLLLRDCLPLLRAVARRRLRNTHEAEDAVQDTLLTIHRMLAAYDPTRPLRPWIVAIAERRCIDRLRRRGRGAGRETPIDDHVETLAAPTAETGESRIAGRQLRDAVAELPESQRTALRLAKLEDLPLAEAARRSGLSIGALKVATHRALKTLRRRLTGEDAP